MDMNLMECVVWCMEILLFFEGNGVCIYKGFRVMLEVDTLLSGGYISVSLLVESSLQLLL